MEKFSDDIRYAYAQLGLSVGSSRDDIGDVLKYALAYRFVTRERIAHLRKLVEFFDARDFFGPIDAGFADIRKAYHARVKQLHPDRNKDKPEAEEELKLVNAAFAKVDVVNREAREFFKQSETSRRKVEWRARDAAANERPDGAVRQASEEASSARQARAETSEPGGTKARKFMAAPVPRSVRTMRLSYLPPKTIIGTFHTHHAGVNTIYDIIMLPEQQFFRARAYLAAPDAVLAALQFAKFAPSYSLQHIKQVTVPEDEENPEAFARYYFKEAFKLE